MNKTTRTGMLIAALLLLAAVNVAAQDHSHHHHDHNAVPDMDAEGKRLDSYEVKHDMDAETLAALREKIALYRGMTDRQVNMNMSTMGPNYEWYASDLGLEGDVGVLLLSHGVGENSDRIMVNALEPIATEKPTAVAFGMAMMKSSQIQSAVDDLTERGAETIILVPGGSTSPHNTLIRQWKYIFDLENEEATYLEVPKVQSEAEFHMTKPFGDSPLISQILYDHAKEVSKNPSNEFVMIIGHGPEDNEDNVPDLEMIGAHVDWIKAKNEFADVKIWNLQDDAIPPVRKSNVKKIRRWITKAQDDGLDVIVVAIASASHGVQQHIRQDLRGLEYTFAEKGMSEHPLYIEWMQSAIEETMASL